MNKKSLFLEIILTLIGSIPIFYINNIMISMLRQDYSINRYSFTGQSRFFSMIDKFEFYENITCSNDYKNNFPKFCARYFTDLLISDKETNDLLKYKFFQIFFFFIQIFNNKS